MFGIPCFSHKSTVQENDHQCDSQVCQPDNESSLFWPKLVSFAVYVSAFGFLLSSNYFEAELPVKVLPDDLRTYNNPSSVVEQIYDITEEGSIKVVEPFLYMDENRASIMMMIYEDFNKGELNSYATGLTYLQELDSPFKNYFGLNDDLFYDLYDFFESTINTLYFDELATDFEDAMDINALLSWVRVRNILRFALVICIIIFLIHQLVSTMVSKTKSKHAKKITLFIIDILFTLVILGQIITLCWIVSRYPSSINKFNLASAVILIIGSIATTYLNFK